MKKILTFSFDDGTVQDRRLVALLDKYGLKCTFNLNSGAFGTVHNIMHDGIFCKHDEINADEVRGLYANHEIAVHTVTHPNLLLCDDERVRHEIGDDKARLEELSGKTVTGMAYPGGPLYDERVIRIARECGIKWARSVGNRYSFDLPQKFMEWESTCWIEDPGLFRYGEQFLDADDSQDRLFYIWGHSFEFDKYRSWERLEKFFAFISDCPDVSYMTNGEVYKYII